MKRTITLAAIGATAFITVSMMLPHWINDPATTVAEAPITTSAPAATVMAPSGEASDSLSSTAKKLLDEAKAKAAAIAAKAKAAADAAAAKKTASPSVTTAPQGGAAWDGVTFTGTQAKTSLATLKVAPEGSMNGYARTQFKTWDKSSLGPDCNTRNAVLYRDAVKPTIGADCKISGTWNEPYTGKVVTDEHALDIDHMVPLAEAWRTGAATWTATQRETYANSSLVTLAVDSSANRQKGDKTPDEWKPANSGDYCAYAVRWTQVKTTWKLTVTSSERATLGTMLATCK